MTDMRRTLLWVVFSMSLVLLWDAWNKHQGEPSIFGPRATAPTAAPASPPSPPSPPATTAVPAPATPTAPAAGATPAAVPAAPPVSSAQVTATSDLVKATFDAQGGTLVRLELLSQKEQVDLPWYQPFVDLFARAESIRARMAQAPNVVLFDRSTQRVYAAQTGLIAPGVTLPNHLTVMSVLPGETTLKDGVDALDVTFESPEVGGVKLRKTWTFKRGSYLVNVAHEIVNSSGATLQPQLYLQLTRDGNPPPGESSVYFTFTGPAMYTEAGKFRKIDFKDIEKNRAEIDKSANDGWIAMVQHYFASAWLIAPNTPREYRVARVSDNLYSIAMVQTLPSVAPGTAVKAQAQLYAGPQEEDKLETLAPGLELVKDYGWFTPLAKPLFWLLTKLYVLVGNWGWAIVALVVVLKIAFYWLNHKAYASMAKMKAINPRVMALRERLKDNPQQMQQEMMRIYREEKVNPLGGCLPILVQMPFFIALYWVLLSSVEMRNAPWVGWITDLSAKDPYFVLPLVMTASSLVQVWLNPTPPDPMQARMMWMMPLMFSVMFFFFPAGLVLYWLTNNILSIAQQWFINKQLGVLGK